MIKWIRNIVVSLTLAVKVLFSPRYHNGLYKGPKTWWIYVKHPKKHPIAYVFFVERFAQERYWSVTNPGETLEEFIKSTRKEVMQWFHESGSSFEVLDWSPMDGSTVVAIAASSDDWKVIAKLHGTPFSEARYYLEDGL